MEVARLLADGKENAGEVVERSAVETWTGVRERWTNVIAKAGFDWRGGGGRVEIVATRKRTV